MAVLLQRIFNPATRMVNCGNGTRLMAGKSFRAVTHRVPTDSNCQRTVNGYTWARGAANRSYDYRGGRARSREMRYRWDSASTISDGLRTGRSSAPARSPRLTAR